MAKKIFPVSDFDKSASLGKKPKKIISKRTNMSRADKILKNHATGKKEHEALQKELIAKDFGYSYNKPEERGLAYGVNAKIDEISAIHRKGDLKQKDINNLRQKYKELSLYGNPKEGSPSDTLLKTGKKNLGAKEDEFRQQTIQKAKDREAAAKSRKQRMAARGISIIARDFVRSADQFGNINRNRG